LSQEFFGTVYARMAHITCIQNITIHSWYAYKRKNTRRIWTVKLLQTTITQLPSTHVLHCCRRRRAPAGGPLFGTKETSSQEMLKSRGSHQTHKTGSSPVWNIGWRNPPSLFNAGPRASVTRPSGDQSSTVLHKHIVAKTATL
jgi:hypothetical protein